METNRPRSRERQVTGTAKKMERHGSGLGTGPVGSSSGHAGRGSSTGPKSGPGTQGFGNSGRGAYPGGAYPGGGGRRGGGMSPLIVIIVAVIILIGGGGSLSGLFGGSAAPNTSHTYGTGHSANNGTNGSTGALYGGSNGTSHGGSANVNAGNSQAGGQGNSAEQQSYVNSLFGGDPYTYSTAGTVDEVTVETGGETVATDAAEDLTIDNAAVIGSREKWTRILGGGKDTVTVMVYMCGTDLESRSGMGTSDLQEMANADLGNINLIVYTGGCSRWKNNVVSSERNQIFQVKNGRLTCLVDNAGSGSMTDPSTLASFIKWCGTNYPANRNELIFWDHGGGSVSGYGYDEKNKRSGSMSLAGINMALKAAGVVFDFIGFDACLMATAENALMLNSYCDYMIASEETEPGVGWYYTDWLTRFASNTSMPTVEVGRQIADDFVKVCAKRCPGQQTTLSVIDLAEFTYTVPNKLTDFSKSISSLISNNNYRQVSTARNHTREFASSNRIDQVDLIDLCENLGNEEGRELAEVLRSAIKYNTCNNISKASGVSIYFPYQSTAKVDSAVNTYSQIGMDASYAQCIKEFASLETAGQCAAGSSGSLLGSLLGSSYTPSIPAANYETDALTQLLGSLFGGELSSSGLDSSIPGFFLGRSMSTEQTVDYIMNNHFDASNLVWEDAQDGTFRMKLSEEQWKNVSGLDLNLFYDDGGGFIDLGLDNIYSFDNNGRLVANTEKVWLSINNVVVPYYHENTEDDGENYIISGRVPCLLNGERSELIINFDNAHPSGFIAGARTVYKNGETDTVSKSIVELENGDTIQPVADYYTYEGEYIDSYKFGEAITVTDNIEVGNAEFYGQGGIEIAYRFRDLYNREYWTPVIKVP